MHGMRRTRGGGGSLHQASCQSAGTAAIKARVEAAVLRHLELQAGSMDDTGHVPGRLILKQSYGVAGQVKLSTWIRFSHSNIISFNWRRDPQTQICTPQKKDIARST